MDAMSFTKISSVLLLFSSLLMELAALSSKGICIDANHGLMELLSRRTIVYCDHSGWLAVQGCFVVTGWHHRFPCQVNCPGTFGEHMRPKILGLCWTLLFCWDKGLSLFGIGENYLINGCSWASQFKILLFWILKRLQLTRWWELIFPSVRSCIVFYLFPCQVNYHGTSGENLKLNILGSCWGIKLLTD